MQEQADTIEIGGAPRISCPSSDVSTNERTHLTGRQEAAHDQIVAQSSSIEDDGDGEADVGYSVQTSATSDGTKSKRTYHCGLCDKSYERLDHVKRHVSSHENARPFKCKSCARRFNRRDLLVRHQVLHEDENLTIGKSKRVKRVIQACQACTIAKTRCENRRPCTRCSRRNVPCVDTGLTRRAALLSFPDTFEQPVSPKPTSNPETNSNGQSNRARVHDANHFAQSPSAELATDITTVDTSGMPQPSVEPDFGIPVMDSNVTDFDQGAITNDMLLDTMDWDNFNFHADLAHIYQDVDFNFNDELLSMHSEPWSLIDSTTVVGGAAQATGPQRSSGEVLDRPAAEPVPPTRIAGHEAFKKSPWLWTPSKQDSAYAGHSQLAVDETQIMASPEMAGPSRNIQHHLPNIVDPGTRDELLAMTINFSKSALKLRSFPSHKLLNVLMQAFFVRDGTSVDTWIHLPTFEPDKCRTELLAALISAGSTLFAVPNIWKMGLALQEVVKLAICDALDNDNRLARDMQTNQTFLAWMEIGLWNGFRRKMEVAEGFAHTVPTMLRRAGTFHQSYYNNSDCNPEISDEGQILQQKWLQWTKLESSKRLVFRVFMNEMRSSIAFVRSPLLSGTELTLTLPASRDLWDAGSAEEWKRQFLDKARSATIFTIVDGIHNPSLLEEDANIVDLSLSAHAILYALWGRIWALLDAKILYQHGSSSSKRATSQLLLDAQHQELYSTLKTTKEKLGYLGVLSPEAQLLCELLMMSLHASSADIQSFAGRFGEREFRQALPQLQEWAHRNEFYVATWHAGQVLRAARLLPPTSLRGFLAIAVYHASLLLWVAAWLSRRSTMPSRASPKGHQTTAGMPEIVNRPFGSFSTPSQVLLDEEENAQVRAYIANEKGKAALRLGGKAADIKDPSTIPAVMKEIFEQNFPSRVHPLPPLLENLVSLMEELSNTRQL